MALPKSKRLNLKTDFKFVARGAKKETQFLKVFYLFGENTHPLIGISLSKKNFKTAVLRNLAKRRVYAVVEGLYGNLKDNLNLIIMPKEKVITEEIEKIKGDIIKEVPPLFKND